MAKRLGVYAQRYIYADGNVQLWEKDLSMVDRDWAFHPAEVVERIGGMLFDPYSNRDEQRRSAEDCTPLPEPTDPEWAEVEIAEEIKEALEGMESYESTGSAGSTEEIEGTEGGGI